MSSSKIAVVVAVLASCAVGCGSDAQQPADAARPQRLIAAERSSVAAGQDAIRAYCRRLGLHLAGRGAEPGEVVRQRALRGARSIATVARRKPQAPYADSQTVRGLAADTAEDLEGTNCSAALVAELARGL